MLKYILITFVFCISTPSFGASQSFSNSSLSMSYVKNEFKGKSIFSINKNALFANKLIRKKRFPIFGIGSIISFFLMILSLILLLSDSKWLEKIMVIFLYGVIVFTILGLCLSIIGLIVGEFWLWSVLGLIINGYILYVVNDIRTHGLNDPPRHKKRTN
jgi:hypothetical protein